MRVGGDIESDCRKCGVVWHVVVAVVDGRIAKVECKQCSGRHRYRPPDGTAAPKRAKTAAPRRRKAVATRHAAVAADFDRPPRTYRPSEEYTAGDRVVHPRFGEGVVQESAGPTRVRVLFSDGERTLVQARKTAS